MTTTQCHGHDLPGTHTCTDLCSVNDCCRWTRITDPYDGYRLNDRIAIADNGGGVGPSNGSGRWALMVDGRWVANIDRLADAKREGEARS